MCISHTACRGSSMMRSRGCTITATGTIMRWGGILPRDPIGPVGGWNPYSYVLNNPAQFIDPTGLTQWTYGEVGNSCVTSQRDFTPPPGLADIKASIGTACSRNNASRNCHP